MASKYSERTIKLLFGGASQCAHPQCDAGLLYRERGHLTVVVQIAHIRSEKKNGPRHDRTYPKELVNSFENLLLLCGTHHPPVDQHDSAYTVEELEEWKEGQIAQSGTHLSAADSAEVFDHIRRSLAQLTQVDVVVELRVGRMAGGGMVLGALKSLRRVTISEDGGATYVAVQVDNRGFVPVTVNAAGLEFSYQRGPEHDTFHLFDTWVDTKRGRISRGAGRLSHHDDMTWICQSDSVYAGLRELLVRYGSLPCYVRPFAELATLDPVRSDEWLPLTDLAPYLLPDDHPDAPFT